MNVNSVHIFDAENVDLSQVHLSAAQRLWIVNRINNGEDTAANLARRFNLNRKHLNHFVVRYRKGITLRSRGGRPRIFADDGLRNLAQFSQEDPHPSIPQLVAHITHIYDQEHENFIDLFNDNIENDLDGEETPERPKIPLRSLKRYATMCDNLTIVDLVEQLV